MASTARCLHHMALSAKEPCISLQRMALFHKRHLGCDQKPEFFKYSWWHTHTHTQLREGTHEAFSLSIRDDTHTHTHTRTHTHTQLSEGTHEALIHILDAITAGENFCISFFTRKKDLHAHKQFLCSNQLCLRSTHMSLTLIYILTYIWIYPYMNIYKYGYFHIRIWICTYTSARK